MAFCDTCRKAHSNIRDVEISEDKQESLHEEVYLYCFTFNFEYDQSLFSRIF